VGDVRGNSSAAGGVDRDGVPGLRQKAKDFFVCGNRRHPQGGLLDDRTKENDCSRLVMTSPVTVVIKRYFITLRSDINGPGCMRMYADVGQYVQTCDKCQWRARARFAGTFPSKNINNCIREGWSGRRQQVNDQRWVTKASYLYIARSKYLQASLLTGNILGINKYTPTLTKKTLPPTVSRFRRCCDGWGEKFEEEQGCPPARLCFRCSVSLSLWIFRRRPVLAHDNAAHGNPANDATASRPANDNTASRVTNFASLVAA
jgi:hypothetical protein